MWHCNRIFFEDLDFPPSLSFHQCFILILILLLLYQKGELLKPGHLSQAVLFPKITECWIEEYFHFCHDVAEVVSCQHVLWRPGFDPRTACMIFVVDKVTTRKVFLQVLWLSLSSSLY
jgi:hypothetical protein